MKKLITLNKIIILLIIFLLPNCAKDKSKFVFEDLYEAHVSNIGKILAKNKINYEITDNGKTIVIDNSKKDAVLNLIAQKGITGVEDFLKPGNHDSELKMVLPGDINQDFSKIFEQMNGIKKADVKISRPEVKPLQDKVPPKATVILNLEKDHNLNSKQISVIKRIIISSIPVMTENDVAVFTKSW
jgi:flagellar biosynthesis/type III secretory pathway M-ring protein FliF/YscJ